MYTKYTINNINLDEFDKILSVYISHLNKIIYLCFFKLTFELKFNDNIIQCVETNFCLIKDTKNITSYLIRCFEDFISRGFEFCNIKHITIDPIIDKCNMTYE